MFRLIIFCIVLGVISLGVNWLFDNDGTISAEWVGYRFEASVSFIIISLTLSAILAIAVMQLLISFFAIPERVAHKRELARLNRGISFLTQGFASIAAGDIKEADRLARKTKQYLGNEQPMALILEAQVAQMEGNHGKAKRNYSLLLENKATRLIGLKGMLNEAKRSGDLKKAVELAEETYRSSQEPETILPVLLELYKREQQWEKAIALTEIGAGRSAFNKFAGSKFNVRRERAILYYMYARSMFDKDKLKRSLELAEKSYKLYPQFTPSVTLIAQAAVKSGMLRKAVSVISKAWKRHPRPKFAEIYLHIYANETHKKQLKKANKLAGNNPKHEESHMIIATAAIAAEDATLARNHLKLAMADGETMRGCRLMAKIEEMEGQGGSIMAGEWHEKANSAIPDPTWMCRNCRHTSDRWELICNHCSSMDSFAWETHKNKAGSIKTEEQGRAEEQTSPTLTLVHD